jgi:hypothetical protein
LYYLGFLFVFIATWLDVLSINKRFRIVSGILLTVFIILFTSLRYEVGADWQNYFIFYKNLSGVNEPLYRFFNNSFSRLGLSFNVFLLFGNVFSLTLIYLFLKRVSLITTVGLAIYYCDILLYFNFSGFRQAIALSIVAFSYTLIQKNKIRVIGLICLASMFHYSAICAFLLLIIPKSKIDVKKALYFLISILSLSFLLDELVNFIETYSSIPIRYYLTSSMNQDEKLSNFILGTCKRIVPLILIITFRNKNLNSWENYNYYLNTYLMGLGLYIITYTLSPDIGVRLSVYFTIVELILISKLLTSKLNILNKLIVLSIVTTFGFYKLHSYAIIELYKYNTIVPNILGI